MSYNMNFLAHMRSISACAPRMNIRINTDFVTNQLEMLARGRYHVLHPQYVVLQGAKLFYVPALTPETTHFIGWRNYTVKRWELSTEKTLFKQYCKINGLRVPAWFKREEDVTTGVIVKKSASSFGNGIEGPFHPGFHFRPLADDEYFEQFIRGDIGKIWFWDDRVVALENKSMVTVQGDGQSTLRELVNAIRSSFISVDWDSVQQVAAYDGFASLDEVVPDKRTVLVDFKYLSALHPSRMDNLNVKSRYDGTKVMAQLEAAGKIFWKGIPGDIRQHTLYTIDAIIDPDQNVWFLEMNSNPIVHPDAYPAMLEGLFGLVA